MLDCSSIEVPSLLVLESNALMATAPDSRGRAIVSVKNKGGEKDLNWRENNKILSSTELVGSAGDGGEHTKATISP